MQTCRRRSRLRSRKEIEQLVAPIALYPDALIAQILMAATYPLEVIHAARWSKANPKVKDKALLALDRRAGSRRCSGDAARGEAPPLLRSRLNSKEGSQWTL